MEPLPQDIKELFPYKPNICQIGDQSMHYVDVGEGEPVVMIHGNPTWSFMYRNLINAMQDSCRCIAFDHIGCGLSSKPQRYNYTLEQHIDNFEKFVDSLGLDKINLVVHDWGGAIGLGFATRHPERVGRIAVCNTAAFTWPKMPKRLAFIKLPIIRQVLIRGLNMFAIMATYMAVQRKMNPRVEQAYLYPYDSWKNRIATERFVKDIPMSPRHPTWNTLKEIEDNLEKLQDHKMLICWGSNDIIFSRAILKEWVRRFPRAKARRFVNANHYLMEDAPDEVIRRIARFHIEKT